MKDENGRCSEKKRLLRTIYTYCQLPKSLRESAGSGQMDHYSTAFPRHPSRKSILLRDKASIE